MRCGFTSHTMQDDAKNLSKPWSRLLCLLLTRRQSATRVRQSCWYTSLSLSLSPPLYTYIYIYTYIHMHIHVHIHMHIHIHIHIPMCVCMCIYIHTCVCICINNICVYIYIYIYMYTHAGPLECTAGRRWPARSAWPWQPERVKRLHNGSHMCLYIIACICVYI